MCHWWAAETNRLEAYVMSVLRIDREGLKIGSIDSGHTLPCAPEGMASHIACEGAMIVIRPIPKASDVEVHESADDGRAYLQDDRRLQSTS